MLVHIIPDYSFLINFTVNKKHHRLNLQLNKIILEDQLNRVDCFSKGALSSTLV